MINVIICFIVYMAITVGLYFLFSYLDLYAWSEAVYILVILPYLLGTLFTMMAFFSLNIRFMYYETLRTKLSLIAIPLMLLVQFIFGIYSI